MRSAELHLGVYSSCVFCTNSISIYAFLFRKSLVGFVRLIQEVESTDSLLFQGKSSIEAL